MPATPSPRPQARFQVVPWSRAHRAAVRGPRVCSWQQWHWQVGRGEGMRRVCPRAVAWRRQLGPCRRPRMHEPCWPCCSGPCMRHLGVMSLHGMAWHAMHARSCMLAVRPDGSQHPQAACRLSHPRLAQTAPLFTPGRGAGVRLGRLQTHAAGKDPRVADQPGCCSRGRRRGRSGGRGRFTIPRQAQAHSMCEIRLLARVPYHFSCRTSLAPCKAHSSPNVAAQVTLHFAQRGQPGSEPALSLRRTVRLDGASQTHVSRNGDAAAGPGDHGHTRRWETVTQVDWGDGGCGGPGDGAQIELQAFRIIPLMCTAARALSRLAMQW